MDYYLKSGAGAIVYANRAWSLGEKMVPATGDASSNSDIARAWVWEVTTAGTSSATPTWPASVTQDSTTVTEAGGVVWTARRPGWANASTRSWAFATIYARYASLAMAAGDRLFVSGNHNEQWPSGVYQMPFAAATLAGPCLVIGADDSQADPASMTRADTGIVAGPDNVQVSGFGLYARDIHLKAAVGSGSNRYLQLNEGLVDGATLHVYEYCRLEIANTHADGCLWPSNADSFDPRRTVFNDCLFKFGAAGQNIECCAITDINGGGLTVDSAQITDLFPPFVRNPGGSDGSFVVITGFDLSRAAQGLNIFEDSADHHIGGGYRVVLRGCKMPDGWDGALFGSDPVIEEQCELYGCSDSLGNKWRYWVQGVAGQMRDDATFYRLGGAEDEDGTPFSIKLATSANAHYPARTLETPEFSRRFPGTNLEVAAWTPGGNVTVTFEVLHDAQGSGTGGRLTDGELWIEAQYLGESGSPLGVFLSSAKGASSSDPFGDYFASAADLADSTEHWITTGMSSPLRQKVAITLAPEEKGYLQLKVHLAKASSTVYVCPRAKVT